MPAAAIIWLAFTSDPEPWSPTHTFLPLRSAMVLMPLDLVATSCTASG